MTKRMILSLILTCVLLVVARRISKNQPIEFFLQEHGYIIRHTSLFEHVGPEEPVVSVRIEPDPGIRPVLLVFDRDKERTDGVMMTPEGEGVWKGRMPGRPKGNRLEYAITIPLQESDAIGVTDDGRYFVVKYKGEVSTIVLILHVIFMFGGFFFMIYTFLAALALLRGGGSMAHAAAALRFVLLTTLVGMLPLGCVLNYQRFGVLWEGIPFGYDITDNKTQILFLFWFVTALLVPRSFFGRDRLKDRIGPRGFAIAVLLSFAVSLALFLVPHSL